MSRTNKVERPRATGDMPVMDLALVLRQLVGKEAQIDRLELSSPGEREIETWRQTNLQAIDGIERAIAAVGASALPEAAIQILIASGYAASLAEEVGDPGGKEIVARIARLLRSALPVIGAAAGIDLHAFGAERYGQGAHGWPFCPTALEDDGAPDADTPAAPAEPAKKRAIADPSEAPAAADDGPEAKLGLAAAALRLVDVPDDEPFDDDDELPSADDEFGTDEQASGADAWLELARDARLSPVLSQILAEVGLRPHGG